MIIKMMGDLKMQKSILDNCPSPKYLRDKFREYFDPCPSVPAFNGLEIPWHKFNYCNPPYSNKIPWLLKAIEEQKKGNTTVFLLPAATGAAWFHDLVLRFAKVEFVRGRLKLDNGSHPRYDSLLITFVGRRC